MMRGSLARGVFCLCVVTVALSGLRAQGQQTMAEWRFNEKAPGNAADIEVADAIIDSSGRGHHGTAYGGDPYPPDLVYPRYVDGVTPWPSNSAMRFTVQDVNENGYAGEAEDCVLATDSSDFEIDLSSDTTYTIDAVIRAPDPMDIINPDAYDYAYPQWYDYTDNTIMAKASDSGPAWAFRVIQGHLSCPLYSPSGGGTATTYSTRTVTGGLWHQVAVKIVGSSVAENRKVQYYIDGVLDSEHSISGMSGLIENTGPVYIASGRDTVGERWSDQFIGDIDTLRFSTGAVSLLPTPTNTVPTMNYVHTGSTDPNNEAHFKLVDRWYGDSSNSSSWQASGYTLASGRLQEVANSYAYYRALVMEEQIKDPSGWTLTGKMKLGASNKPWNECLGVEDGRDSWVMSFMDSTFTQGSGDQGAGVYKSGAYDFTGGTGVAHFTNVVKVGDIDPTAMFHTYQLIYDPSGDGGNGIVKFYMDGQLLGTQTRGEARDVPGPGSGSGGMQSGYRFWFGDSYPLIDNYDYYWGDTASDAYWGDVKLQTGAHLAVPWDPNFDGVCGAGDLDIVRSNWGQAKTANDWAHGELTGDGTVGAADLDLIRSHWGQSVPVPGIGPVPEPSTFLLVAIGGLMLLLRRRGR